MRSREQINADIKIKNEELFNLEEELDLLEIGNFDYLIGKIYKPAASFMIKITSVDEIGDFTIGVSGLSVQGIYTNSLIVDYDGNYRIPRDDIQDERIFETEDGFNKFILDAFEHATNKIKTHLTNPHTPGRYSTNKG